MKWIIIFLVLIIGCANIEKQSQTSMLEQNKTTQINSKNNIMINNTNNITEKKMEGNIQVATFAGGCFWCMEAAFQIKEGVISAVNGYTGGIKPNPTYEEVSSGSTGHLEAVEVTFDANIITYKELLDIYWKSVDPTDNGGQFADQGSQYKTAIFYHDENQKEVAIASKKAIGASDVFDKPITTPILPAKKFYIAEEYHQDYYEKKSLHYNIYKKASGRQSFLEDKWK